MPELEPGKRIYSVATGRMNPFIKASRDAATFIGAMDGLVGVHVVEDGRMLWFFDSLNHAKVARNLARAEGIECGSVIGRFTIAEDGVPEADTAWFERHGAR